MKYSITKIHIVLSLLLFSCPFFVHGAALQKPPNNLGLVAFWPMNEGTTTIVTDFSGTGNNGTMNTFGTSFNSTSGWTYGKFSNALNFDGSSDYISVQDSPSLKMTGDMTITAWLYADTSTGGRYIVEKGLNDDDNYALYLQTGGVPHFEFEDNTNTYRDFTSSNSSVPNQRWTQIAVVYSDSGNTVTFYKNGLLGSSQASAFSLKGTQTDQLYIGRQNSGTASYFDGKIDEVRIYNRALTGAEIAMQFNDSKTTRRENVSENGLVGYWSMNEGTSTQVTDFSNTGNNGTTTNMSFPATATSGWTNGKLGKALSFDGVNDLVDLSKPTFNTFTRSFTVAAWIKKRTLSGVDRIITASTAITSNGFGFGTNGSGLRFTTFGVKDFDSTLITLQPGIWYHVAAVMNNADDVSLYLNGAFVQTITHNVQGVANTDDNYFLGSGDSQSEIFDGQMDDVRVYNRELSSDEIAVLGGKASATKVNASQNNRLTNGLVGMWSFNGADMDWGRNIVYDRSGNNNNGTTTSMSTTTSPVSGKVGQALNFDGDDDLISVPDSSSLSITGSISITFWFKSASTTPGSRIVWKRSGASNDSYDVSIGAGGVFSFTIDSSNATSVLSPLSYVDNSWHHFAGTWNQSTMIVYVDGALVASGSQTGSMADTVNPLTIGNRNEASSPFTGSLDEVRIYNRAITGSEVKQLYLMGR